jgi:hypothetical protein
VLLWYKPLERERERERERETQTQMEFEAEKLKTFEVIKLKSEKFYAIQIATTERKKL